MTSRIRNCIQKIKKAKTRTESIKLLRLTFIKVKNINPRIMEKIKINSSQKKEDESILQHL